MNIHENELQKRKGSEESAAEGLSMEFLLQARHFVEKIVLAFFEHDNKKNFAFVP
jgi:hypothetical protein